jgi:hypothetical protein
MAGFNSGGMPTMPVMPEPPDSRIIPLDRQPSLSHQQVEQVRFGLGDTGPLAQAVMNSNAVAFIQCLPFGITASSGMIIVHACSTTWVAPRGWLECNGAVVAKATYPQLYAVLGATYGETDTTFTLPTIVQLDANLRYVVKS